MWWRRFRLCREANLHIENSCTHVIIPPVRRVRLVVQDAALSRLRSRVRPPYAAPMQSQQFLELLVMEKASQRFNQSFAGFFLSFGAWRTFLCTAQFVLVEVTGQMSLSDLDPSRYVAQAPDAVASAQIPLPFIQISTEFSPPEL